MQVGTLQGKSRTRAVGIRQILRNLEGSLLWEYEAGVGGKTMCLLTFLSRLEIWSGLKVFIEMTLKERALCFVGSM